MNSFYHLSGVFQRFPSFLDKEDHDNHDLLREIIGKWFAFEVERFKTIGEENLTLRVATHINVISPLGQNSICPKFSERVGYQPPIDHYVDTIFSEYNLNVRGKQLFQMLSRFLSYKDRFSHFSEKNLIEIALKKGGNQYLQRLIDSINFKLSS
jgi:hypothetical protein